MELLHKGFQKLGEAYMIDLISISPIMIEGMPDQFEIEVHLRDKMKFNKLIRACGISPEVAADRAICVCEHFATQDALNAADEMNEKIKGMVEWMKQWEKVFEHTKSH